MTDYIRYNTRSYEECSKINLKYEETWNSKK